MRNTKIALAVLALVASTAAMAEATVYGTYDIAVTKQSNQPTQMNHSTWDSTVLGFKGSEDLGGMKATFQLEAGLDSTNGGTSANGGPGTLFNRQSNIGLTGDTGTVKLGTQLSPFIAAAVAGFATGNQSFFVPVLGGSLAASATSSGANAIAGGTNGFFIPNAVSYTTPVMGGFQASVLTQLSANAGAATVKQKNAWEKYTAFNATYNAGDLGLAFGYENNGALGAALDVVPGLRNDTGATKVYTVAANYTMGPLRLAGGYINHSHDLIGLKKIQTWHLGAAYAVQENLTLSANYASFNRPTGTVLGAAAAFVTNGGFLPTSLADIDVNKRQSIINFSAKYDFSKRTYSYATVSRATNGASSLYGTANQAVNADSTGYGIGVGHRF
jgi:predicted porin